MTAYDPPTDLEMQGYRDEMLEAVAAVAGGAGAHEVTITVQDDDGHAVQGARITVHNHDMTDSGIAQLTDTLGQCVFHLDAATYQGLITSTPIYAQSAAEEFVVNGVEAITLHVVNTVIPAPADPNYCAVYCYANRPGSAIPAGATFRLQGHDSPQFDAEGWAVCYDPEDADGVAVNETTGYAVLTLRRGAKVRLEVLDSKDQVVRSQYGVYVPYADSVNWADLTTTVPTPPA
jgi:hypothetical protein